MKKHENFQRMQELVAQWQQSGMSQIGFAQTHDLKIHTFKYWINKFRDQHQSDSMFIQLQSKVVSTEISLRYPNGVELRLPSQTPVQFIKNLVYL